MNPVGQNLGHRFQDEAPGGHAGVGQGGRGAVAHDGVEAYQVQVNLAVAVFAPLVAVAAVGVDGELYLPQAANDFFGSERRFNVDADAKKNARRATWLKYSAAITIFNTTRAFSKKRL